MQIGEEKVVTAVMACLVVNNRGRSYVATQLTRYYLQAQLFQEREREKERERLRGTGGGPGPVDELIYMPRG